MAFRSQGGSAHDQIKGRNSILVHPSLQGTPVVEDKATQSFYMAGGVCEPPRIWRSVPSSVISFIEILCDLFAAFLRSPEQEGACLVVAFR